ncbi:MAG: 16S rRNA (guanine(527)-N(7))-methyltransferase RsmG [Bacteroidales bacterium]|nr:16S rRNA (guanine(527)-N(7))-methyltransferase RsmG [Bacteroidales bacterium]
MSFGEFISFVRESFELSELQLSRFEVLDALYRDWNTRINVISRKDIDCLYDHHVLHSLAIAKYLDGVSLDGSRVLDLGTGGGFPGIPLAILYPGAQFTLCDSVGKKTIVAEAISKALSLDNVRVVNARAESLEESFDWVVSRAVASLPDFYPWVKGKYAKGILYLKGGDLNDEICTLMSRHRLPKGSVHTWPISSWLPDPYYAGKLVVHIEK